MATVLVFALSFTTPSYADHHGPSCNLKVTPNNGGVPLPVVASGSCTAANSDQNSIVQMSLDWGDGSAPVTTSQSQITAGHTFTQAGKFQVVLTGTDSNQDTGSASQMVKATAGPPPPPPPPPPTPTLTCNLGVSPSSGQAPLTVNVSTSCSDSADQSVSILVSFGDGFYLSGANVGHTYVNSGSFHVSVVASDKAGNTFKPASQTVAVSFGPALFVGISGGKIAEFNKSGTLQHTLNSNQGGSMTGMAFDASGNLYATNFTANTVSKFNPDGTLLGTFGSGYNCKPESIVFDSAGNAYVGETGCSHALLRFDAYGNLTASYTVATEAEGSDWIDLAPDGCTLFYTSQGASVLRFDACGKRQLPPFSSSLKEGLALGLLQDGGALVANLDNIIRLDSAGRTISTYVASGEKCWASLTLDSDRSSFWAADYCTSDVIRFDLTSGNQVFKFNTGTPANTVFGLAEGPPAAAQSPAAGPFVASPAAATIGAGQSASFALALTASPDAVGRNVSFSCANLPLGSACSFSPGTLTAPNGTTDVNLTITTSAASSAWIRFESRRILSYGFWLPLALAVMAGDATIRKKRARLLAVLLLVALLMLLLSLFACSGAQTTTTTTTTPAVPAAPLAGTATPAGAYTVIVRAHAGTTESSTAVLLTVQ
ncbi:MAG TPA: PKD domain-containing protein [Terriglobales bacterium]|nr:PKD domain-containing protein [Terriglobales bacterium]